MTESASDGVEWLDDEEEQSRRHHQECDRGIHEEAVLELAPIQGEVERREIRLTEDCGDEGGEQPRDDCLHHGGEGTTQGDRDRQVDSVSPDSEGPELL